MRVILNDALVGVALLVSVGYVAISLGPKSVRRALLRALSRTLAVAPAGAGLRRAAERLAIAAAKGEAACGGCDNCGSVQPAQAPPSEVRIPVAKVGRRS